METKQNIYTFEKKKSFNLSVKGIEISIASSEEVLSWSSGEVRKPETINYKTYKPEKLGLFDEQIFGPVKDFRCYSCGHTHKRADVGKKCTKCGESIISMKKDRRRKMGHIKLATPASHIWFSKIDYSIIRSVIGLKQKELEQVLYYKSHIVYDNGKVDEVAKFHIINVQNATVFYRKTLKILYAKSTSTEEKKVINTKIDQLLEDSESAIGKNYGIDFYEYNNFIFRYSNIRIGTGAEAVQRILKDIDLEGELIKVKEQILKKKNLSFNYRRNRVIESFLKSDQSPSLMIMDVIPIIPVDMRPLIQLDGGRHSTVDINELYRRIIIRNNRLANWFSMGAPDLIIQNEKRMLQEAIDALFDNSRKSTPALSKSNRPLKSIAENLKGKQGRFRQNLLGKRVDYSGRSVIVVGPYLKLNQVGLPKQMVVKLFEPFIIRLLISEKLARNIRQAKKMIETYDDRIWKYATRVIENHPVLLNRAPTLHRLSIQSFEPVITDGKAIRLHPLITTAFNADFDGDQMAVYVPLSRKAKKEAKYLVNSTNNILSPKDGKLIISPSQDMILGIYYLSKINKEKKIKFVNGIDDLNLRLKLKLIHIHDIIAMPLKSISIKFDDYKEEYKYVVSTAGRFIINSIFPTSFKFINNFKSYNDLVENYLVRSISDISEKVEYVKNTLLPINKSDISKIIEKIYNLNPEDIITTSDSLKDLGFIYSTFSGISISLSDVVSIPKRENIIEISESKISRTETLKKEGFITDDQRYLEILSIWGDAREDIKAELQEILKNQENNSLFDMMDSGARGNISNFTQLAGLRGLMSRATHEYAALKKQGILIRTIEEIPIKSSFKLGLNTYEYFISTHGARKGLSDTATKTAESGYLTRRLVDAVQDILVVEEDCEAKIGWNVSSIIDTKNGSIIEKLEDRIYGRYLSEDLKDNEGNLIYEKNHLILEEEIEIIEKLNLSNIKIRSAITCQSSNGICSKCFGIDLTQTKKVSVGEAVGIIAAQSIGEPGTQLTMRTFHTGGVSGVTDITQGFTRLIELLDANANPKGPSVISKISGEVKSIEANEINNMGVKINYVVKVVSDREEDSYIIAANSVLRVGVGSKVSPGSKITEGVIKLQHLLEIAGQKATQSYLLKEIQRLYRIQGIEISDKYIEIIIKQMFSKIKVVDVGDSELFINQIISKDRFIELNTYLFADGKTPIYGVPAIIGVKELPLRSESFLAAASYQRTAEALVKASIGKQVDDLSKGIKQSMILGLKINAGTGFEELHGKYKIFTSKEEDRINVDKYYQEQEDRDGATYDSRGEEVDITNSDDYNVVNED